MASDRIIQKALVQGRIVHAGTGGAIIGSVTITSAEGAVTANIRSDGTFAVSGKPELLFPDLATVNTTFHLLVRAVSTQFRAGWAEQSVMVNLTAGELFTVPVAIADVVFPSDPVYIRGRVSSGADPFAPIAGATIDLLVAHAVIASTATAADGSYAFNNVVVSPPVDVNATAATFTSEGQTLAVDYSIAVNEVFFRMKPA